MDKQALKERLRKLRKEQLVAWPLVIVASSLLMGGYFFFDSFDGRVIDVADKRYLSGTWRNWTTCVLVMTTEVGMEDSAKVPSGILGEIKPGDAVAKSTCSFVYRINDSAHNALPYVAMFCLYNDIVFSLAYAVFLMIRIAVIVIRCLFPSREATTQSE